MMAMIGTTLTLMEFGCINIKRDSRYVCISISAISNLSFKFLIRLIYLLIKYKYLKIQY